MDSPPVHCGRRLLPHVVDDRAEAGHKRPIASIPRTKNAADGYVDISYKQFANAINRLATWITHNLGEPKEDLETLVYLAPADLRYQMLAIAAVKAGYMVFLVSPRNSAEAFDSLLEQSGATKLLTDESGYPGVAAVQKCRAIATFHIPSLATLLDPAPAPHVPLNATWEDYRYRPFLQIHSSGSTGIPKLITLKHGSFSAFDAFQYLETNDIFTRLGNVRMCVSFPPFHVAGLIYALAAPIWLDSTVVIPPATPLTAEVVDAVHVQGSVQFTMLPPSIVTDLAKNADFLKHLAGFKGLIFAGGPLSEEIGRLIVQHTALHAGYGASEWMAAPLLPKDREDWPYFRFNERQGGLTFRERDNGLHEMVLVRQPENELWQPVFITFPEINEFASKDLFAKHPSKPGLWKYVSRWDDIIVFSNGEKLNPVTFEGLVSTSPDVKGCLVVGQGRFQAALVIEPKDASLGPDELMERLWPHIQQANKPTVRHGRVTRDFVLFTKPDKPLPRAGKGTIQRAAANNVYANEIDQLYSQVHREQDRSAEGASANLDISSHEATTASLLRVLRHELETSALGCDDDFFAFGMDSLQVINLVREINRSRPAQPIEAKQVYDYPTVTQLSRFLHRESSPQAGYGEDSDDEELKESWLAMDEMYAQMTSRYAPTTKSGRRRRHLNGWIRSSDAMGPVIQPDGGRVAWLQVLAMFLVNLNNWGLVNSFGVFQSYYQSNLLSNHTPSAIAWIGTLQGALLLIVGVISGPLFDKGYFKATLVAAGTGLVFALMMLSLSTQYYQIILSQGVLMGVCQGLLYIPSIALVPVYFKHKRGLALGLSTGGGSVGGVLYPIMFYRLLEEVGFAWAVRIMGFVALVTLGVATVLSKPLGNRSRRQLLDPTAFQDWPYVAFIVAAFLIFAGIFVPFFLAVTYSGATLGTSSSLSFYLLCVVNAAQLFGRVLPSWAADFRHTAIGPEAYLFIAEFGIGIMGFWWAAVTNLGGYVAWLVVYGFLSGIASTMPAVVLPYISPNLAVYGTRIGMLYAAAGAGFLISTPIATAANEATGSFLGSQVWTGAVCLAGSLLFLVTAFEARKRRLLCELGKHRNGRRGGIKNG